MLLLQTLLQTHLRLQSEVSVLFELVSCGRCAGLKSSNVYWNPLVAKTMSRAWTEKRLFCRSFCAKILAPGDRHTSAARTTLLSCDPFKWAIAVLFHCLLFPSMHFLSFYLFSQSHQHYLSSMFSWLWNIIFASRYILHVPICTTELTDLDFWEKGGNATLTQSNKETREKATLPHGHCCRLNCLVSCLANRLLCSFIKLKLHTHSVGGLRTKTETLPYYQCLFYWHKCSSALAKESN